MFIMNTFVAEQQADHGKTTKSSDQQLSQRAKNFDIGRHEERRE